MECLEESDYMEALGRENRRAQECITLRPLLLLLLLVQHSSFIHTGWWMDSGRSTRVVNLNNSGNGNDNESDT